ncbi:MAG: DUF5615 family PIN-like protein [Spirochaetaceae bacterium]|nr:DUF5615 family PIN-like protein [Spirochaetaceae bacterium]
MNLLADESVDRPIVDRLRRDGHSVRSIAESDPGIHDAVLNLANRSGDVLITADKDFSELVFRMGRIHTGVVLIRLAGLSAEMKAGTVSDVLASRGRELTSVFSVISPGSVRIRRQDHGE